MTKPLRTAPALLCVVFATAFGCGRRTVDRALQAELDAPDVVQGLLDVQVRGFSPEQRQLLLGFGDLVDDEKLDDESLEGLVTHDVARHVVIRVDPARAAQVLAQLRGRDDVLYAEPVVQVQALWTPNDPEFAKQWHLRAAGATAAWDSARGRGVTVAVIDTGIAPVDDLDARRLVAGHDFLKGTSDAKDDHGHGTHVAGTIAQSTGNGVGTAGMAPEAKLMPLKVLSAGGYGTSSAIAEAIRYAVDHGAQVLNLSLGGGARSAAMADAVAYARRRGAVVVCAAGNSGGRGVSFPAAYPGALAVSAVGPKGTLAPYSSFGPEVRLAAPGGDKTLGEEAGVLQETIDPQAAAEGKGVYRWYQGTSMATPHVAGAAALLVSLGVTAPAAVERLLTDTASEPPAEAGAAPGAASRAERYGQGLLDAGAAVRRAALRHGLLRLALAVIGALAAIGHARKLQQLRPRERLPGSFWAALGVASGALTVFAPLGLARLPGLWLLAAPLPSIAAVFLGLPHASLAGSAAALVGWSALPPFALALVARAAGFRRPGSLGTFAPVAAGFAFGWAGLLLGAALLRTVYLPWLPALLTPPWLLANALVAWFAGRGLFAREGLR